MTDVGSYVIFEEEYDRIVNYKGICVDENKMPLFPLLYSVFNYLALPLTCSPPACFVNDTG